MATLITVVILQIPDLQLLEVADLLDWIFMVLPNYSLGMAFNNLYTNARAVEYCTRPLVALACSAGIRPNPCCKGKKKKERKKKENKEKENKKEKERTKKEKRKKKERKQNVKRKEMRKEKNCEKKRTAKRKELRKERKGKGKKKE